MTAAEIRLVQSSFAQVDPIADQVAAAFYGRMFEIDPDVRSLFKIDIETQGTRFMEKLAVLVKGLEDLEAIAPFVRDLGRRHVEFGVKTKDYGTASDALNWALEDAFGTAFTPELKRAWLRTIQTLCDVMIGATEE